MTGFLAAAHGEQFSAIIWLGILLHEGVSLCAVLRYI